MFHVFFSAFCSLMAEKDHIHVCYISISDVNVLVIMVTNEVQAETVLYGDLGAVAGLRYYVHSIISLLKLHLCLFAGV